MDTNSGSNLTFEDMSPAHGRSVGRLHGTDIEHSFMSGLGAEFLAKLYEILLTKGYGHGTVLMNRDDVVGFCFGRDTLGPSMGSTLLRSTHQLLWPVVKLAVTRPRAMWNSIIGIFQSKEAAKGKGVAEWQSVCVVPGARAGERSYKLVEVYFEKLRREGYHLARGAAHEENVRAQKFFLNLGGRIYEESHIGGKKILWFEWDLTSLREKRRSSALPQ